jgi:hypothetical protein
LGFGLYCPHSPQTAVPRSGSHCIY